MQTYIGSDGSIIKHLKTEAEAPTIKPKRITYSQNWKAYDAAQTNEKKLFLKLLSELCQEIEEPMYKFGRPISPLKDIVFAATLKVYSTFSLRRFMTDLQDAASKGYVGRAWSFSAISKYMRKESLTPIIDQLIALSAMPLSSVEVDFAADSSGFRVTKFNDYCKDRYMPSRKHSWVKLHIYTGVKTNIITGAAIGEEHHSADSPQFIPLLNKTASAGFTISEVSADKAYNSIDNYNAVAALGGVAYIPYRSNITALSNTGNRAREWRRMYNFFIYRRDEFLKHYHLRSNAESTFSMLKAKFSDLIKSKDKTAQKNEALLKVLCHNIVVLIHEMNELGIEPNFFSSSHAV
ncbi:MAG: transposase [Candidatus Micrarchaeota archaeon]|nr:transposase [Candidatus Micrarchaeota archaeon]